MTEMANLVFTAAGTAIQTMQMSYNVSCTIRIVNDTDWHMTNPVLEIHNGSIAIPPDVIKPRSGGVVGAHKTAFSVFGCGATVTWDIDEYKFQLNFGIAGGGVSWLNANHLKLAFFDGKYGGISESRRDFTSAQSVCHPVKVDTDKIVATGTMGNTDCAEVRINISEK